ncbi:MAG TPA: hypothetical protein DCZ05_06125 [Deltaproteobacteria bacterium]|nr:MAG: hypothetical protein A2X89_08890 [Deltaproteobacteria bacterium GWD2_55_8]HBA39315.1 hypothetical protein [Deltaproteobacteria bacterium]
MADEENVKTPSLDDILADAISQRYCPVCLILEKRTSDLLCQLQYDAVHNDETKEWVISSGGYCHFHFWYIDKLASPTTNAQLLDNLLERIRSGLPSKHDVLKEPAFTLGTEVCCPVCSFSGEREEELLTVFASKIEEKEGFRTAYQRSRGLCFSHVDKILQKVIDPEVRTFLVTTTCRQLDVLIEELKLQVAKWHNKDRSSGEEHDSTYRAIEKLVGGRNYWIGSGYDK